jgi:hypothetical protein
MKTPRTHQRAFGHAARRFAARIFSRRRSSTSALSLIAFFAAACSTSKPQPAGMVPADGGGAVATPAEAGTPAVDISTCAGCQLAPTPAWSFEGIYSDAACTVPLAQITISACASVPALGSTSVTYVDDVGLRKANETATVTLSGEVPPTALRYRKNGKGCVRANEAAVAIAPPGCANQKICRDATGALACTGCRTFANGCPNFEETRLYATIDDAGQKAAGGGGGGNLGRLGQCCAQLAAEAARLGASPEAGVLLTAAAQCRQLVAAAGPNGNAPELGALRAMLAGRNIPAVCAGF